MKNIFFLLIFSFNFLFASLDLLYTNPSYDTKEKFLRVLGFLWGQNHSRYNGIPNGNYYFSGNYFLYLDKSNTRTMLEYEETDKYIFAFDPIFKKHNIAFSHANDEFYRLVSVAEVFCHPDSSSCSLEKSLGYVSTKIYILKVYKYASVGFCRNGGFYNLQTQKCNECSEDGYSWSIRDNRCFKDCSDFNSNKFGFTDGSCADCSNAKTDDEVMKCYCKHIGSDYTGDVRLSIQMNGKSFSRCDNDVGLSFKTPEDNKKFGDNAVGGGGERDENDIPSQGGGSSDEESSTTASGSSDETSNSSNETSNSQDNQNSQNTSNSSQGDETENNTDNNSEGSASSGDGGEGGSGQDDNGVGNGNASGDNSEGGIRASGSSQGGSSGGSEGGGKNIEGDLAIPNIGNFDSDKLSDDLSEFNNKFSSSYSLIKEQFDNFISDATSFISNVRSGKFVSLNKNKVQNCIITFPSVDFKYFSSSPFNVDMCEKFNYFYYVFYFLTFVTASFLGVKFIFKALIKIGV